MDGSYCLHFVFILLGVVSFSVKAQDVCVQKTACSCEFSNGTGIDLSESAKSSFFTTQIYELRENNTQYELATYYYHPCFDVLPKVNTTVPGSTCNIPLSICRHANIMKPDGNVTGTFKYVEGPYEYMGSSNFTKMSPDGHSIEFANGPSLGKDTNVSSIMLLVCAETDDRLDVYSAEDPRKIVLSFYSRNACLRQIDEVGRSTGSTLLIIFFSFVVFYLVLGVCTKKFLMGATGVEVVPNLAFWSDLPNLVKDGWAFTLNGFKLPARGAGPTTSPDPNSYDSI
ncbi:uncharacterized protein LOC126372970 isoform X1 [Pectinophora gossypiella]|nr:uncharacterized protein LOC126372970 isoform X1 [Pectinophora gossypiella]